MIARVQSSVQSLHHQRRDLHQSTYHYLSEDRDQPLITIHLTIAGLAPDWIVFSFCSYQVSSFPT
jgi:hypothetical protein